ncbi:MULTISPECIES: phosphoribosyltransferase family protein [Streptomyces]|uniref:Phosphoribosyl transferase n=2 Tax=Streptomyces TaxID=1883 RepID=A0A124ECB6_9ACTN|nr:MULTISPECIES: alpha/beta family hydrolase [Streptomyces]KUH37113.1 phosphoribosyl transferase [Streptomyces kanasensis]UUS33418.1 phosphoribosyltransferase family protein [Streptomyces changanensis]
MRFTDRADAGRRLAAAVAAADPRDPVVLGLPRGGVPVAHRVAEALAAPLDVLVVRKLGVPSRPELGFGAIGEDGVRILNDAVVRAAAVGEHDRTRVEEAERAVLEARLRRYRRDRGGVPLRGRTAVLVDDGVATGSTALAACRVARAHGAARVVVAVPVAPREAVALLRREADEVVCLASPDGFGSVGQWYDDFTQTSDEEVAELLALHGPPTPETGNGTGNGTVSGSPGEGGSGRASGVRGEGAAHGEGVAGPAVADGPVEVVADGVRLAGDLVLPDRAPGVVVFAHGSGSGRLSPRNRAVARALQRQGLGTLLFDLLTETEGEDRERVFDIPLLARRLARATAWLRRAQAPPVCYFGASTGAAAALTAAAEPDADVAAIVSRGGRPDLAGARLDDVRAPVLLIVGGADASVLPLNRRAAGRLRCEHAVEVVPGATHLFEEPGAMEQVEQLAAAWFLGHLPRPGPARAG